MAGTATRWPSNATATLQLFAVTATGTAIFDTFELEGFRWRDDNGNEITADWLQLQDVNHACEAGTELRIRVIVQIPGVGDYTLECAEDGTEDWFEVEGPP